MSTLNFHVRHEVTPGRVWDVLTAVVEAYPFQHITQAERQLSRLRLLGLIEVNKKEVAATTIGFDLYRIGKQRQAVALDILHYLHYSLWCPVTPLVNTLAWSYRTHCDALFARKGCKVDYLILTSELNSKIYVAFETHVENTKKGAISLSANSLKGIHHWLRALEPSVLLDDAFALRHFCSPELFLLAVALLINEMAASLQADLLLTAENRERLCQICLLASDAFDRVLDWTLDCYPAHLQPGTHTGSYGRFIRLQRKPVLGDFIK